MNQDSAIGTDHSKHRCCWILQVYVAGDISQLNNVFKQISRRHYSGICEIWADNGL